MDFNGVVQSAVPMLTLFALKVVGAIALWVIGRWLIRFAVRLLVRSLKYPFDQTVAGYIGTAVSVLLTIALIIAMLGFFGIETTSFAALMAGVGIAIGAAWSGLLAHLAAGIFILILRPYKIGDPISAGGILGTVEEIGLFVTTISTLDNVKTFRREQPGLLRQYPELFRQPLPARGSHGAAGQRRGSRRGHPAPEGAPESDPQRETRAQA
jgi:small conductance mechanosensitive channel